LIDSKHWLEDVPGFFSNLNSLGAQGKSVARQELPLSSGRTFEWDYVPIPAESTATGIAENLLKWRDITERLEREAQRRKDDLLLRTQKAKLEKANIELKALATTDGLTGLRNQRTFHERLGDEFRRARRYQMPLSLIMLDVDDFKSFNDTYGHPAGNSVLRAVSKLLQRATRETDIVCRYGGEEFAAILPHTRGDEAMVMAERIREAIERAHWEKRSITISAGVCTLTPDMVDAEALTARADQAMYVSKNTGKNRSTNGSMELIPRNLDLGL
jgi:diguanylate cyclase (GGDEF)-like protein